MVEQCCVDGCFSLKEDLNYFKLPVSRTLRKRWVEAISSSLKLTDDAMVCSRHFQDEQYMFVRGKRRLKSKVVPCVFERKVQKLLDQNKIEITTNGTAQATDKPPDTDTDKPNASIDNPNASTDNPNASIDKPKASIDKPDASIDNPNASIDKPNASIDNPKIDNDVRIDNNIVIDKCKGSKKSDSPEGSCRKSSKSVEEKQKDIEFSPHKDIEEIITNYHIKQTRPLSQISAERAGRERDGVITADGRRDRDRGIEEDGSIDRGGGEDGTLQVEKPQYVEVSVGGNSEQANEDCLMLLENVQVEVDPGLFPQLEGSGEERDESFERVDLDHDSSSDCIHVEDKKDEPISLLSSSDEDEVIIQEPHIETVSVSDATDEDDLPLLALARKSRPRRSRLSQKRAAIAKIHAAQYKCEVCSYATLDASDYSAHMGTHSHVVHMCELCNYRTSSWFLMHRHKEKHGRESKNTRERYRQKRHKCPLCAYRAKHSMSLVYHMAAHGEPARCPCGFAGAGQAAVAHAARCSRTRLSCDICEYVSPSKAALSRHLRRCHSEDDDVDFVPPTCS